METFMSRLTSTCLAAGAAIASVAAAWAQQPPVGPASSAAARPAGMASTTVGVSPVARQSFEHGLSATVGAPPVFTVQLTWAPYPGADSYRVLRSRLIY